MGGEGDGPGGRSARRGRRRAAAPGERPHDDAKGRRGWRVEAGRSPSLPRGAEDGACSAAGAVLQRDGASVRLRDVGGDGKP